MDRELLENINRNLEVIIALLVQNLPDPDAVSLRERVLTLDAVGMRPKDIAKVLGKSPSHVSKELSLGRGAAKKKFSKS
jgi:DNA-directed RNA polymerase specialized sigma24 family protein